jgi:hypothetical protein
VIGQPGEREGKQAGGEPKLSEHPGHGGPETFGPGRQVFQRAAGIATWNLVVRPRMDGKPKDMWYK